MHCDINLYLYVNIGIHRNYIHPHYIYEYVYFVSEIKCILFFPENLSFSPKCWLNVRGVRNRIGIRIYLCE